MPTSISSSALTMNWKWRRYFVRIFFSEIKLFITSPSTPYNSSSFIKFKLYKELRRGLPRRVVLGYCGYRPSQLFIWGGGGWGVLYISNISRRILPKWNFRYLPFISTEQITLSAYMTYQPTKRVVANIETFSLHFILKANIESFSLHFILKANIETFSLHFILKASIETFSLHFILKASIETFSLHFILVLTM